jgi:succinate dehydrogenase / fumarate reductase flavoprotein subunit
VAVLSKVFPTRSHTVAAQGGIGASLGNMSEDNWHYHFYDTVKGSDWLGDQDAIEFMCREAPKVVYELEHIGMPFDRNPDGTIYQRPFGGHTANYGEKPVQRACAAADRTGHAMLHTLYQQNVKARTNFFVEWMALDLIRDAEGDVVGVTALEMETGDLHILQAKTVLLATGGAGRIFAGLHQRLHQHRRRPGHGRARRHPAARHGVLAVPPHRRGRRGRAADRRLPRRRRDPAQQQWRALHGALRPTLKDLAPRDFVSRCMDQEIKEGRGCGPNKDYICSSWTTWARHHPQAPAVGVRDRPQLRQRRHHPEPIPVVPTIHYQMGGIPPTSRPGRGPQRRRPQRAPSTACTPWANAPASACTAPTAWAPTRCSTCWCSARRRQPHRRVQQQDQVAQALPADAADRRWPATAWTASTSGEYAQDVANDIRATMQQHAGVFRTQASMDEGVKKIAELRERVANIT